MGNSASNPARQQPPGGGANAPGSGGPSRPRSTSKSPSPGNPHSSMRTKKKSLELPDLVSLMVTTANQGPPQQQTRGRQGGTATAAKAIPIPAVPQGSFRHYEESQGTTAANLRPRNIPSGMEISASSSGVFSAQQSQQGGSQFGSTNRVPSAPRGRQQAISNRQQRDQVARLQELYNASQQAPSGSGPPWTPSGSSAVVDSQGYDAAASSGSGSSGGRRRRGDGNGYPGELVRSSIPLGLLMQERSDNKAPVAVVLNKIPEEPLAEEVSVKIVWNGGGASVLLARAGDDDWKGRQAMEQEGPATWTATVMLRPGTHHVRFLVDGQWRVADDLPTAVDDQGSLANYVDVPVTFAALPPGTVAPSSTPSQTQGDLPPVHEDQPPTGPPNTTTTQKPVQPGQSFWSADSSADGEYEQDQRHRATQHPTHLSRPDGHQPKLHHIVARAKWTNVLPPELIEAARQEDDYLAASAGQFDTGTGARVTTGFVPAPNVPPAPALPRHLDKLILNTRVGPAGGNGGPSNASASGRERDRERDRDKGDAGGSAVGAGQGGSGRRRDKERERERERGARGSRRHNNVPPPPPPSEDGMGESGHPSTATTAGTTPTGPLSPTQSPPTQYTTPNTPTVHESLPPTDSTLLPTPPSLLSPSGTQVSGSRTITLDMASMPPLTDDASVLPVPSHVVLHHLSTSAIKNGVLAVGNTTRYRKKYLTTIYYKPT